MNKEGYFNDYLLRQILEILKIIKELMEGLGCQQPKLIKQEVSAPDKWLTVTQVRFMLDISTRTLYNYVQQGKLISKKRGGINVYLKSSVIGFIEE